MKNNMNIKAIILAAGEGKRLHPYTLDRPKCLVEVDKHCLLDRQIDVLKSENIDPIILVGGYLSEMLRRPGINLRINPRYAETNMVWTLFCADEDLEGDVIISYGDIVYSRDILKSLINSNADISVTIDLDWESYWRSRNEDPLDDAETLKLRTDGTISEIGQKPNSLSEIEGQYMGLIKLSNKGVKIIKSVFQNAKSKGKLLNRPIEIAYMTDLLQEVINSGFKVDSVPVHGGWVEVDTVSDLNSSITRDRLDYIKESIHVVV